MIYDKQINIYIFFLLITSSSSSLFSLFLTHSTYCLYFQFLFVFILFVSFYYVQRSKVQILQNQITLCMFQKKVFYNHPYTDIRVYVCVFVCTLSESSMISMQTRDKKKKKFMKIDFKLSSVSISKNVCKIVKCLQEKREKVSVKSK